MRRLGTLDWTALILLIIGGLNWGLIGLFNFDVVGALLGRMSLLTRAVYILVGLSAAYVAAIAAVSGETTRRKVGER